MKINYGPNELTRFYSVTNPKKEEDNILYTVNGKSPATKEKFLIERRFQHFFSLR
jgi:hypothetical protein